MRDWRNILVIVADSLCLLGLLAWLHAELTGGGRIGEGAWALSNRSSIRVLSQALVIGAVRHLLVSRPSVFDRWRGWLGLRRRPRITTPLTSALDRLSPWVLVLIVVAITRASVLAAGYVATTTATPTGETLWDVEIVRAQAEPLKTLSWRWDAAWYANLVNGPYRWNPEDAGRQQNVAFFPAYSLLVTPVDRTVAAVQRLLGRSPANEVDRAARTMMSGTFVSVVAFAIALGMLFHLARVDLPVSGARRAVVLAATYPFAYFFSVPYTESLFFMAVVGAFLAQRTDRHVWVMAFGLLAGLTRQIGFLVTVPLLVAWAMRVRAGAGTRQWHLVSLAGALSPAAGASLYSAFLWWTFGDPLAWVTAQGAWETSSRWIHLNYASSFLSYAREYPYEAANLAAVVFAAYWTWRSRTINWSYVAFGVVAIGAPLVMNVVPIGRMTAPVFPMFLGLAAAMRGRIAFPVVAGVFMLLQLVAAAQFYSWRPMY